MKARALLSLILLALLVLAFIGCKPQSVSIEDRIALFLSDVNNSNWSSIYLNFHPTLTQDYDIISTNPTVAWDVVFPSEFAPYSITSLITSNPGDVTGNMNSWSNEWGGPYLVTFRMAQFGEDWMIQGMDIGTYAPLIK